MSDSIALVALPLLVAAGIWSMAREDRRLRRQALRYRELALEGMEEAPSPDAYPEEAGTTRGLIREPDGRVTDPVRVLTEELDRARAFTRMRSAGRTRTRSLRNGKGAACLL
jgi:hypothetical protein